MALYLRIVNTLSEQTIQFGVPTGRPSSGCFTVEVVLKYIMRGLKLGQVFVAPHDKNWATDFENDKKELLEILTGFDIQIDHVGSTSLPNTNAKPIIDILIGTKNYAETVDVAKRLVKKGITYGYKYYERQKPEMLCFTKELRDETELTHIYIAPIGTRQWNIRYLNKKYFLEHPDELQEYQNLKQKISAEHSNDRIAYKSAKKDFMDAISKKAYELYNACDDVSEIEKLKTIHTDFIA